MPRGHIGEVVQVLNLAPHRLSAQDRPAWFFEKNHYGGIITDIGSHQVEQFLTYAGCSDAPLNFAYLKQLRSVFELRRWQTLDDR